MGNLGTITKNFQEIYHAVHDKRYQGLPLVANRKGTRIYHSGYGWGRIWILFYALFCPSQQRKCLFIAMKKLGVDFEKQTKQLQQHYLNYENYLKEACNGKEPCSKKIRKSHYYISFWKVRTSPFLKMVKQSKNQKLLNLLSIKFIDPRKRFGNYHKIFRLEGKTQFSFPVNPLSKLSTQKKTTAHDKKLIKKWIKKINKKKIPVRLLHQSLRELVAHINKHHQLNPDLSLLEFELVKKGCKVFNQVDKKHNRWRKSLEQGTQLREVVLEKRIGKKKDGKDYNHIYAIENNQDQLVTIGINESTMGLKKYIAENEGFGFRFAEIHWIEPSGKYALVERLKVPYEGIKWLSNNIKINPKDLEMLEPIINTIKWMIERKKTPHHLSPKYLWLDKNGVLKSSKVTCQWRYDIISLENFIYNCANGNSWIYHYMIKETNLKKDSCSNFFERILENPKANLSDLAGIWKITDEKIVIHGKKFLAEALRIHREKYKHAKKLKIESSKKNLKQKIWKSLINTYKNSQSLGRFVT